MRDDRNEPIPPCFGCGDSESATGRLVEMFVDIAQRKRIDGGQMPAERPVFRKLHGVAYARLEMRPDRPFKVGVFQHDALDAWVRFSSDTSPPYAFGPGTPNTLIPIPIVDARSGDVGEVSLAKRTPASSASCWNTPTLNGRSGRISKRAYATPCSFRNTGRSAGIWPPSMRFRCAMSTNISTSRPVALSESPQPKHGGIGSFRSSLITSPPAARDDRSGLPASAADAAYAARPGKPFGQTTVRCRVATSGKGHIAMPCPSPSV